MWLGIRRRPCDFAARNCPVSPFMRLVFIQTIVLGSSCPTSCSPPPTHMVPTIGLQCHRCCSKTVSRNWIRLFRLTRCQNSVRYTTAPLKGPGHKPMKSSGRILLRERIVLTSLLPHLDVLPPTRCQHHQRKEQTPSMRVLMFVCIRPCMVAFFLSLFMFWVFSPIRQSA